MKTTPNLEMQAFVTVVEHASFTGAASALGLTPSAVSKLVSRLEDRLGVRLLHRTTRRLALSSEGDLYYPRARQILSDIEEVEAEVAGLRLFAKLLVYFQVFFDCSRAAGIGADIEQHQLSPCGFQNKAIRCRSLADLDYVGSGFPL